MRALSRSLMISWTTLCACGLFVAGCSTAGDCPKPMSPAPENKSQSASTTAGGQPAAKSTESLYKRLGGYDAIAAVTDDFLHRLLNDTKLNRFFVGHSEDSTKRIRQLIVDQLCAATGGPCEYIGRDTNTAHAGLGITEEDWTATVNHLVATLDKFKVPAQEKSDLLALLTTLKPDIVMVAKK